jgi:hypothetical protein
MKPIYKKLLIGGGAALVYSSIVGFKKFEKTKAIFEEMDIEPHAFSKLKIDFDNKRISFNLDVLLRNNTDDDLFVTGSAFAVLKEIDIFYKNNYMATAQVNINEISIPAENQLIVRNIPVMVHAVNLLQNATVFMNFNLNDLGIVGVVEAFGTTYRIGEE